MGKQAKLRKIRQQAKENPPAESTQVPEETDPNKFVKNFEQKGYKFTEGLSSPEIPEKETKPQI